VLKLTIVKMPISTLTDIDMCHSLCSFVHSFIFRIAWLSV